MKFARESVRQVWDEAERLLKINHAETGALPQEDFSPNRQKYAELDYLGVLELYTMRDDKGALVGYSVFIISDHPHYRGVTFACQDVLFVVPEHRGINAVEFMAYQDARLKEEDVHYCYRHVTQKVDYSKTLERMGYAQIERKFLRKL